VFLIPSYISSKPAFEAAKEILLPMGEYFQIQVDRQRGKYCVSLINFYKDDYLDCYGDPAVIGKIGRDIEENKCSWLVVQALLRASPAQRAIIDKHYGIDNPDDVAVIKKVYLEIGIPDVSN
jgi:farnesyl diphosphate synthase